MESMRTEVMNKYIVWTSAFTGEYVKADTTEEFEGKILFIRFGKNHKDAIVKDYKKSDILDYHEVKWSNL